MGDKLGHDEGLRRAMREGPRPPLAAFTDGRREAYDSERSRRHFLLDVQCRRRNRSGAALVRRGGRAAKVRADDTHVASEHLRLGTLIEVFMRLLGWSHRATLQLGERDPDIDQRGILLRKRFNETQDKPDMMKEVLLQ